VFEVIAWLYHYVEMYMDMENIEEFNDDKKIQF
jgi:hypothetical protein